MMMVILGLVVIILIGGGVLIARLATVAKSKVPGYGDFLSLSCLSVFLYFC